MQPESEQLKSLDSTLREIMRLLDRQALEHHLVARSDTRKPELAQSLLARQHAVELEKRLNRLHPADAAFVLASLQQEQRIACWHLIARERHGAILLELADSVRAALVTQLDDTELIALGRQMEGEDFAELVQTLPPERIERVLGAIGGEASVEVRSVLSFPEDSVGALMRLDAAMIRDDFTVEQAIASLRRRRDLPEPLTSLIVVDRHNELRGVLSIDRLVVNDGGKPVRELMNAEPVRFLTTDPVDDAAQAFERYDLIEAPVVNMHGQVVGSLTVDDVLDHVTQDSFKQSLQQVGLSEDEDLFAPALAASRKRWVWLGLNLCTAFVAARVVGAFEGSIAQLTALAALMPIVASIGGNTGNQAAALVIRGLALSQINAGNMRYLLKKELLVGASSGLLLGVVMGLATMALYGSWQLATVMAAAMLLNMLVASAVGVLCPLALDKLGRDPVIGSSILLTATTDSMGFLIFLGLATALLL